MMGLVSNPDNAHPQIQALRKRLDEFYRSTRDYTAFQTPPDNSQYYRLMKPFIERCIEQNGSARVLELGAGLPTFPKHFQADRDRIQYDVQDVTPQNREHLQGAADNVFIGDVADVSQSEFYDVVFSTFVLEHVATPEPFLRQVKRLLRPGGWHFVFCPRYDAPGYLCPSLRHRGRIEQQALKGRLALSRLCAIIDRGTRFWVNPEPSVLHQKWYRDADAVHLVSRRDLEKWHRQNGFTVTRLSVPSRGLRQSILHHWLIVSIACQKAPAFAESTQEISS